MYTKFIILSAPRCGTNYLSYLLHSHPNIVSSGELFNQDRMRSGLGKPRLERLPFITQIRDLFPIHFLKFAIFTHYPEYVKAVGFKILYYQLETPKGYKIASYLRNSYDLKVIHLKRENFLDSLVSLKLSRLSNVWSTFDGVYPENVKINLNYDECVTHFTYLDKSYNKYNELFKNHSLLNLSYERLIQSTDAVTSKILTFLAVDSYKLTAPTKKLNTRPITEIVENFGQLKHKFSHTRWSQFFVN